MRGFVPIPLASGHSSGLHSAADTRMTFLFDFLCFLYIKFNCIFTEAVFFFNRYTVLYIQNMPFKSCKRKTIRIATIFPRVTKYDAKSSNTGNDEKCSIIVTQNFTDISFLFRPPVHKPRRPPVYVPGSFMHRNIYQLYVMEISKIKRCLHN